MSKKFKTGLYSILCVILLIFVLLFLLFLKCQGFFGVQLKFNGSKQIQIEIHEPYQEEGIRARWKFEDVSDQVQIFSSIDTSKLGKQEVSYQFMQEKITRIVDVVDTTAPHISLIGQEKVIVFQNEEYTEEGINAADNSLEDLQGKINISQNINTHIIGQYEVLYEVSDSSGNRAELKRAVWVVKNPALEKLFYHYDDIDNTLQSWWFHKAKDHERKPPSFDPELMEKYNAIYLGNDEKVIYLTYDEGGSDITYIKEITDILNHHDIQATYFLTRNYIKNEAEFMRELVNQGHVVANHTRNHYSMRDYATESGASAFVSEITDTQKTIYEVTQQEPPMIFRFPKGEYSERALAMVHDLGYQTVFWSHAYHDYGEDVSKEEAYNNLITHLHPGAIYLLHPSNKGNLDSLNDFIEEAIKQNYRFDVISSLQNEK